MSKYGYVLVLLIIFLFYLSLRKLLKLPRLGKTKQKIVFFSLAYITGFLWDNYAVISGHWEYKNMIGIYMGYSPIENLLFAIVYPIAVVTVYQLISIKFLEIKEK